MLLLKQRILMFFVFLFIVYYKCMEILIIILQLSYGLIQTSMGLVLFLLFNKCEHFYYKGAIVTKWKYRSSISLGLFIFISDCGDLSDDSLSFKSLLSHEYGHCLQSVMLGPLYLVVVGLPSFI